MAWLPPKTRWTAQDVITAEDFRIYEENARSEYQLDQDHLHDFAAHYQSFDLTVEYNHPHRYPSKIVLNRGGNTTTYDIAWDVNMLASINVNGTEGPYTMRTTKSGNIIDVLVDTVAKVPMDVNPPAPPWKAPHTFWNPPDIPDAEDYNRIEQNQDSLAKTITQHHADLLGHNPERDFNIWTNADGTVNSVTGVSMIGGQGIVPKYTNGRITQVERRSSRTYMVDTIGYDSIGRINSIRRRVSSLV